MPGVPVQYWKIYRKIIVPPKSIVIEPGAINQSILPNAIADQRGLFSHFHLNVDNPALIFTILIDDQQSSGTLTEIYDTGYIGYYIPGMPFLSKYDTTNNIYVVNVVAETLVPFFRNVSVTVTNPTTSKITIGSMEFDAYLLKPGFYTELAKVIGGKDLPLSD